MSRMARNMRLSGLPLSLIQTGTLSLRLHQRHSSTFTKQKIFSEDDVKSFVHLTGDHNSIHVDSTAAQAQGFEKQVVPGSLLASLFPAIIGTALPGAVYLSQTLKFRMPALVGDQVLATVEVTGIKRRLVSFKTVITKGEQLIVEGDAEAFVPRHLLSKLSFKYASMTAGRAHDHERSWDVHPHGQYSSQ